MDGTICRSKNLLRKSMGLYAEELICGGIRYLFAFLAQRRICQQVSDVCLESVNPVGTGRKLNVHKTFIRRPGRLRNVLCTINLRPSSTGK